MDTEDVLRLLVEVSEEAINPRFRALSDAEVAEKNPGDLVTVADREAEVLITERLRSAYPGAVILGEEAYSADASLMDAFRAADHAFTVDPVDGTKNFVRGSPDHAVMVSEIRGGEIVRGWIWQPQHGLGYVAEKGAGAYRNGERLRRTPPPEEPGRWRGVTSRRDWIGRTLGEIPPLELTWISCGIDYPHLVEGDADFLLYSGAHPWDHAPGGLLLAEAGGELAQAAGGDYRAQVEVPRGDSPIRLVAAASPGLGQAVVPLLGA